jgi:hypothetical protein
MTARWMWMLVLIHAIGGGPAAHAGPAVRNCEPPAAVAPSIGAAAPPADCRTLPILRDRRVSPFIVFASVVGILFPPLWLLMRISERNRQRRRSASGPPHESAGGEHREPM